MTKEFDDKDELDEAQEEAVVIATEIFEDSWKRIKQEIEGVSKKEACKYSFILGFLDYMKMMDKRAEELEKKMKKMSKEDMERLIANLKEYGEEKKDELWNEGSYIKSINSNDHDYEEKMRHFEEKSDEKKEHNCKKCNKSIGKHNLYWHEGMCNNCFFDKYNM